MLYRSYSVDSGAISIGGTSTTQALYIAPGASATTAILRVAVMIEAASSPAPPSNGSVLFTANVATGTVGGGAAVTPTSLSPSGLAAQTVYKSGSTAITGMTLGAELWSHAVPFTSGASWEDALENTGLEIWVEHSTYAVFTFTAGSGAGSGCTARIVLMTAE